MKKWLSRFLRILIIGIALGSAAYPQSQKDPVYTDYSAQPRWVEMMQDPKANFFEVQRAFYQYWENRPTHRGDGYKPFKRWEYYWQNRVNPDGSFPAGGWIYNEYQKFAAEQPEGSRLKSGNSDWLELGPKTRVDVGGYVGLGRLNAIACSPVDTSVVYVGSPAGGLWKTTDGGNHWVVLTDGLPSLGASSILIHPAKPDELLVGTGDRDHGDARGIGVIRSTDGGHTWQMYNNGMGEVTVGMMERCDNDPNFILAAANPAIYKTTDGGATWTLKFATQGANFRDIKFKPGSSTVAYATSVGANGFYRTEDGGETWVQNTGTEGAFTKGRMVIGVTPAAPNIVYVICSAGPFAGCWVSQDDGLTFALQSSSPNILGYSSDGSDNGSQAWYDLCVAVDGQNSQIVYVGGVNLWRSDNSGKNWKLIGHWTGSGAAEVHADQHALYINPVNRRLYAGNDGGIYYTDNKGTTWKEITVGLGIGQIYRLGVSVTNPYLTVTGFQDNGSATWTGKEWYTSGGGDGMESAIDPTDYLYSYTTLYYGAITQNIFNGTGRQVAGKGFGGINEDGPWVTPFLVHQDDGNVMIAGYKNIWITDDLKNTPISWKKISNNLAGSNDVFMVALEQSPAIPTMLYASRQDRRLFRTDDFTRPNPVWFDLSANLPVQGTPTDLECHPYDPMTVYITLGRKVYKSADKGETWTDISGSLPNIPMNTLFFDESSEEGLYVGTDAGAYFRDAGMSDWIFYNKNLPVSVEVSELEAYYNHLDRSKSRLRASTFGRGLWETPLASSNPILPATSLTAVTQTNKISLYWNAPYYPQYVTNYRIFRNNVQYDVCSSPYYTDDQVQANTDYTYYVVAMYAGSTASAPSNSASAILADPVTFPYLVDFEPGTAGWGSSKTVNGWKYGTLNELGIAGNYGHYYGIRGTDATVGNKVTDDLISPVADLTSFAGSPAALSFNYSYLRSPDAGTLNVVYRVARDSAWKVLTSLDPVSETEWAWKTYSLVLPDSAMKTTTQIAFRYENHGTSFGGAAIDDIQIKAQSLGIANQNNLVACRIFPNPTHGKFQLELTGVQPGNIGIQVISVTGQVVFEENIKPFNDLIVRSLNLENQPKGVYQVRIQTRDGVQTERITIQ